MCENIRAGGSSRISNPESLFIIAVLNGSGTLMKSNANILVTGASTGIGKACFEHLSQRQFRVFACVRDENAFDALKQSCDAVIPLLLDLNRPEMIDEATIKIAFKLLLKGYKAGKVEEAFMNKAVRSSEHTGNNFLGVELAQTV